MTTPTADDACRIDGVDTPRHAAWVALDDPAVQYGLALFETLAVRHRRPLDLDEHLERLHAGVLRMELPWPGRDLLARELTEVAESPARESGWLKVILTGAGRRMVFGGAFDPSLVGTPISAVVLPWRQSRRGPLVGLKTTSYAGHALGTRWAEARGAGEGLWLNDRGHLAEGCRSNLFLVVGGSLLTPAISDGILPGVVRDHALAVARERGLRVHCGKVRLDRVRRAREAFVTSSLRGVRPLIAVDGRPIGDGTPGPLTRIIDEGVRRRRGDDPVATAAT